ncbi:MAG TPA: SAM-dependent methyltransferase [Bacteroides sp.]|nr:SAM-dependent methyltransferase [Bacteroides sp.]
MSVIVNNYGELPMAIRRPLWQWWHKVIIRYDLELNWKFLNYGYQSLNGDPHLSLLETDETDRYSIQLYDHVVNRAELLDKDVLEVGSGRGGGASYISRYYDPKSYTALDISASIIDFCKDYYDVEGLSFKKGVAEDLPFEAESFDTIVNVESARVYKSLKTFFSEAYRVLRKDGKFLIADMIRPKDLNEFKQQLKDCGFRTLHETEITANVVESLNRDCERRQKLIRKRSPGFLVNSFNTFAGIKGTERYKAFTDGTFEYWSFVLEKVS